MKMNLWNFLKTFLNNTPLILASEKGHDEIVKALLSHKDIDVNIKNVFSFFFSFSFK